MMSLYQNKTTNARKAPFYYLFLTVLLLTVVFQSSCTSSKSDDTVTPQPTGNSVIPGAPEKFKNPEGYMTMEVDGKPLEFGISIASSQLRTAGTGGIYGYSFYAATEVPKEGVKSITINLSTKGELKDIGTLKGVHKSSTVIDDYKNTVRFRYTVSSVEKRSEQNWMNDKDCTVEITSTTSPWIEGTFTADNALSGPTPLTIKKGVFKIRYEK
ncbi:hypothetical protein M0L20_07830 [Spirosoma sp. RP8]|uniref:Lipoprotein n=1 Tax=Spirosoma liriopis TaxID=2937440 RepID=A0ABT0HHX1_9BACT|nr:hypothetical protein [Spirosoma liriopis]MCK8491758.1 hypothetical protein [Spirosoma liriopis]